MKNKVDTQEKCKTYYSGLELPIQLTSPHKCKPRLNDTIEVHEFCDTSMEAYETCMYIRSQNQANKWNIRLLCSKSRLAPLKGTSIPRLELTGVLLLAQLAEMMAESWDMSCVTICL